MIITPATQLSVQKTENQPFPQGFTMVSGKNDRMAGAMPVWDTFSNFVENIAHKEEVKDGKATDSSFGFSDMIDMVNPLQHIPIVSNFYQSATGDTIGSIAKIVGGALFGGPIGAVASIASVAYHAAKDNSDTLSLANSTPVDLANRRAGFTPYNV